MGEGETVQAKSTDNAKPYGRNTSGVFQRPKGSQCGGSMEGKGGRAARMVGAEVNTITTDESFKKFFYKGKQKWGRCQKGLWGDFFFSYKMEISSGERELMMLKRQAKS